jgi:hypothetical protein
MIFGRQFFRWYLIALLYWVAGEVLVSITLKLFLKVSLQALVLSSAIWLIAPTSTLPMVYYSWSLLDRPKLRALVFSFSVMLIFLTSLLAIRVSLVRLGISSQEYAQGLMPAGLVGAVFASVVTYIYLIRKLRRQAAR